MYKRQGYPYQSHGGSSGAIFQEMLSNEEFMDLISIAGTATEYDHKTQPKLTLSNQNYGRNVPKPYS